jgi:hypothetical protein
MVPPKVGSVAVDEELAIGKKNPTLKYLMQAEE